MSGRDGRTPLTWADVRQIRRLVAEGGKHEAVGAMFGITNQAVDLIVKNKRWHDPSYTWKGFRRSCERPDCRASFTTRRMNQRFCSTRCRSTHNQRLIQGRYLRWEEQGWMARRSGVGRPGAAIANARALQAPLGHGPSPGALADILADVKAVDPHHHVEQGELHELLDGLTEDDLSALDERALIELRARLAAAGFVPSTTPRGGDPQCQLSRTHTRA